MTRRRDRTWWRATPTVLAVLLAGTLAPATTATAAQPADWWQSTWRLDEVWQISQGEGVTVAVVDTGVDPITDLDQAVLPGIDLTDRERDGRTDDGDPKHGTAMALVIAGRGTQSGMRGIAPAATILPIGYLDGALPGGPTVSGPRPDLTEAIRYAVDHGAQIINMSLGGLTALEDCPSQLADTIRYAASRDVVLVASSGNFPDGPDRSPATCPGVVTVGAVDGQLQPWSRSHRSRHVDVAAPGTGMAAPLPDGQVGAAQGTSYSAALVSGTLALLRAAYPQASGEQLVTRLIATTEDVADPGRDDATGYGFVRPLEALTATVPPDAPNPVYEPLGDLTNVTPPPATPGPTPVARPTFAPPSSSSGDDGSSTNWPLAALAIGVALLLGSAVGVVIHVRRTSTGSPPYR